MKKIVLILIGAFVALQAYSQEPGKEFRTVLDGKELSISGFAGPMMSFSVANDNFAHFMGGGGAVLVNNFFIGGYGMGLTNDISTENNPYTMDYNHGGLWIGYNFFGNRALHPTLSTTVGWGNVNLEDDYNEYYSDGIFVVNPCLELELNVTRYFKIGVGGGYRLVSGVDKKTSGAYSGYSNSDFSGAYGQFGLKFGWFD